MNSMLESIIKILGFIIKDPFIFITKYYVRE